MSWAEWSVLAAACMAGAVSPGPSMALVMLHASQSLRGGLACAWAHALGVGVYAALAVTGLAWLLDSQMWLQAALSIAAALWLLRMAYLLFRNASDRVPEAQRPFGAMRDGLSMGLVNPKVAIFFAAIFTAVLPDNPTWLAAGIAVVTAVVIDGLWYSVLSLVLQEPQLNAFLRRQLAVMSRLSAGVLLLLGVYLLWQVWQ